MADISSITLLSGNTYNLKDSAARQLLDGHSVAANVPADASFTDTTYTFSDSDSGNIVITETEG